VDESILYIAPSSRRALPLITVGSCPSVHEDRNETLDRFHTDCFMKYPMEYRGKPPVILDIPTKALTRVAYLLNDNQGHHLLVRLKSAWNSGLIFTIGTSLSTGESAMLSRGRPSYTRHLCIGPFGYPDPGYIPKCNASLDALQVPGSKRHKVQNECISCYAPPSMVTSFYRCSTSTSYSECGRRLRHLL
jgi:hypothetical protein